MLKDFLKYQTQTTPHPLAMEVSHAKGSYIYDTDGKAHLDFVAGVSACSLGHCHPAVVNAVKEQMDKFAHVMVYGEYAQGPAVALSKLLAQLLPAPLTTSYLVNSGTEAIEASLKLARRATGRTEILFAHKAYHGNTMGSMSVMDHEERRRPFEPLIPDCHPIRFNNFDDLSKITNRTAAVILETIQGGAGFILPAQEYLKKVKERCESTGTLLILDEIQPGFGRTGKLFGFQHFDVVPDVVVMGKGMGGGLPIGALTASYDLMQLFRDQPKLSHITTFGGNPVIAAAALATLTEISQSSLMEDVLHKEVLFRSLLIHPLIKEVRGCGLMLALITESSDITDQIILGCQRRGLILFWLLFEERAIRITPPLTISEEEIKMGCAILTDVMEEVYHT